MFLLLLSLLPVSAYSKTCEELACNLLGKTCVSNGTDAMCVDFCKEKNLAIATVGKCTINYEYCSAGAVFSNNAVSVAALKERNALLMERARKYAVMALLTDNVLL